MLVESYSRTRWLDKHRPAGAPHRWMGQRARWHLSWPLADTTAQKKRLHFSLRCMSSLRLSMLLFSVSFKRETPRIMFVILTQGPFSPVLVQTWRSSYADTVGEGVKKLARAQANVPSRFQSRVEHANSIRLSHAVVHHRSSTISRILQFTPRNCTHKKKERRVISGGMLLKKKKNTICALSVHAQASAQVSFMSSQATLHQGRVNLCIVQI